MPFPLDEKWILETEEKLGTVFPSGFRAKMMKVNGGEVATPPDAWILYPFFDRTDMKRIKRTCADIVRETKYARGLIDFPEDAVSIGNNGGGDQLIFIAGENGKLKDSVYWWDHETGDYHHMADCFSQLREI